MGLGLFMVETARPSLPASDPKSHEKCLQRRKPTASIAMYGAIKNDLRVEFRIRSNFGKAAIWVKRLGKEPRAVIYRDR